MATWSDRTKQAVVAAGAIPGLVALLGSGKGEEAEKAAAVLCNVSSGSDGLKQAVVDLDVGALPGLVNLLRSSKGDEALQAAWALRNLASGSDGLK